MVSSSGRKRTRPAATGVSPGRRAPGEQVYRSSDRAIRVWTIVLLASIPALLVVGGLVSYLSWTMAGPHGDRAGNPGTVAGNLIMLSAVVLPLVIAAALGGEALHKGGSIVGVVLVAGIMGFAFGGTAELSWMRTWGVIAIVVGVLGFFALGYIRRVPIWIGGVGLVRKKEVSDGLLPGESAPGVLSSKRRHVQARPEEQPDRQPEK